MFSLPLLAQRDRIEGPVDDARKVVLAARRHPLAQPQYDLGPVDPAREIGYLTLSFQRSPEQQASLDGLLAGQQNPSSPDFHKWLTPEQYAGRFGLSSADTGKIVHWLRRRGFKVEDVARGRHWIAFSGPAGRVQTAFATEIHRYRVNGEMHFANTSPPSIPAALAGVVSGIEGLNDFPERPSAGVVKPPDTAAYESGGSHYLVPADLAAIYDINPLYNAGIDGAGQTIAVIGQSNLDLADVRRFRSRFNLPPAEPQVILVGPDPGITSTQGEADLDIEWSGAVAPKASIVYVYARSARTAAQYAVDRNLATVLSLSFGSCEPEQISRDFRAIAQQANAQGITWLASSGDSGAAGCDLSFSSQQASKGYAVSFFASMPEVTAVGGTQFDDWGDAYWNAANDANSASAFSYIPEKAWNETGARGLAGSGGGASMWFERPSWQPASSTGSTFREVPDVSLAAAGRNGYVVILNGAIAVVYGTSAATPCFAAIVALLNQYLVSNGIQAQPGLGNINPALYRLAQTTANAFHDIASGDNLVPCAQGSPGCGSGAIGYQAAPGFDPVTGLGSVDANNLVTQWNVRLAPTSTALSSDSSSAAWGSPLQLTATVSAAAGAPSGSVTFLLAGKALGTAVLSRSNGIATATLKLDTSTIPPGAQIFSALYQGDGAYDGSSGATTVNLVADPGASAVIASVTPNPIPESQPDARGRRWIFTIALSETAGVATTLTSVTINGSAVAIAADFGDTVIPANGKLGASFFVRGGTVLALGFDGRDDSGQTWSRRLTIPLTGGPLQSRVTLSGVSPAAQQNPGADPSCQWSQQLILEEDAGFHVQLTKLLAGSGADLTGQMQQLFGTLRLAPFGVLQATVCLGSAPPAAATYDIDGTDELGLPVVATWSSAQAALPASQLSVSQAPLTLSAPDAISASPANLPVTVTGAPSWTAAVFPATAKWLQAEPDGSSGGAQALLRYAQPVATKGAYAATVVIRTPDAAGAPAQAVAVPVALNAGTSATTSIASVSSDAAPLTVFAPGELMNIYGSQLAPGPADAAGFPWPITLSGVTVTVNGVAAPIRSIAPEQLNIQIPFETGAGWALLGVNNNGEIASYWFQVAPAAPAIYADSIVSLAVASAGRASRLYVTGAGDMPASLRVGTPPSAGGAAAPKPLLPVTVTVAGIPATIRFAGAAAGRPGVIQIDFNIPDEAPAGVQPVIVTAGSAASPPVNLTVNP